MSDAAPPEELRRLDAQARARAQREFCAPLVLEAGAGTGKTATLVARVVAWCLGPGWERAATELAGNEAPAADRIAAHTLRRVVAITFTEAAAAEMAARVEQALVAVESGTAVCGLEDSALPEPELRRPRAAALRDGLEQLVVQTLHAYARRVLSAHPFEARLHPNLEVDADGTAQAGAVRAVLARRLREAYAGEGDALALAAVGHGPRELELELLALLENGVTAEDLAGDPLADDRVALLVLRLRGGLGDFLEASEGRLAGASRSKLGVQTTQLVETLRAGLAADASAETLARLASELRQEESCLRRLREWAKGSFNQDERRVLADRGDATREAAAKLAPLLAHVAALDLPTLVRGQRLLAGLLGEALQELDRRGIATFASLLSRTAWLLESRPDVARSVRRDIDQLLVDEFQDTDPLQCAIVGALGLGGEREERPGLFLVGDPKQSIYGWRDADLAAYEEFVARVLAAGGELHRLSVNHRSLPAVLAEVERVIAPVMLREPCVQPAFEPLIASDTQADREFAASPRFAGVEHWVAAPFDAEAQAIQPTSASEATRIEARALAADLQALRREREISWQNVGVLFRSRGDWEVYLSALREAGIPFAVEGDRSYYRRREIIDASAWVRCVLDRNDHIALVGALRGPVVGVPDAAWVPLFSQGFLERVGELGGGATGGSSRSADDEAALAALRADADSVAAALPKDIPGLSRIEGWQENLSVALAAISSLRASFETDPGDVFVEKLRAALLLEATEAARFLGPWRVANLERFFRDLTEELAAGVDTQELLRRLRHAVAEEEEMEEEPPHDAAADAVQILTLHGAKGLDFDHVYLMQLHKGTGRRPGPRIDAARVEGQLELRVLGVPTLGFDRVAERRARVAEAERVRLLYVGMTRARERLVLSAGWPEFQGQRRSDTHALLLTQRSELPDLSEGLLAAARAGRASFEASGARFVLPVLRSEPPTLEVARAALLPASSSGSADAVSIARRRLEAEARMQRPLEGTASSAHSVAPPRASTSRVQREIARLAGVAVHRCFESLDLSVPVAQGLRDQAENFESHVAPGVSESERAAAIQSVRRILAGLVGGVLLERLERVRHQVVARELPVLLPPGESDEALAFLSGQIDLVYRDPKDGSWVVVDFKTEAVAGQIDLDARAAAHAPQGAVYCRALQEGLSLPVEPRFELWFLAADRWVEPGAGISRNPEQMSLTLT